MEKDSVPHNAGYFFYSISMERRQDPESRYTPAQLLPLWATAALGAPLKWGTHTRVVVRSYHVR